MSEATAEPVDEQKEILRPGPTKPWHFGSSTQVDPREAGRRGGSAPRRSKTARLARERVLASKNGAAALSLLRLEVEREQERERNVRRLDKTIAEMDLALHDVREEVVQAREELHALELAAEQQRVQLEQAKRDPATLAALLRAADKQGILAPILESLDFALTEVDA